MTKPEPTPLPVGKHDHPEHHWVWTETEMRWIAARDAAWQAAIDAQPRTYTQAEVDAMVAQERAESERLRVALRFYANGWNFHLDPSEEFDTVSGEPQNWMASGLDNSETMIEDGTIAACALRGIELVWIDGDEDTTPQPIHGERARTQGGKHD